MNYLIAPLIAILSIALSAKGPTDRIEVGDTFELVLNSKKVIGYEWYYLLDRPEDKLPFILIDTDYKESNGAGVMTFTFRATKEGYCPIVMVERKAINKMNVDRDFKRIEITVHPLTKDVVQRTNTK